MLKIALRAPLGFNATSACANFPATACDVAPRAHGLVSVHTRGITAEVKTRQAHLHAAVVDVAAAVEADLVDVVGKT